MRAISLLGLWLFLLIVPFHLELYGQKKPIKDYRIVFYNTENLFDPFDDPATNDGEYTPGGKCHWTMSRLDQKVMMVLPRHHIRIQWRVSRYHRSGRD